MKKSPRELSITVEEWLWTWHGNLNPNKVKSQTRQRYSSRIRLHIVPELGKIPLRLLTSDQVREFIYTTLPAKKRPDGGRLLEATAIRHVWVVLNSALKSAVINGKLDLNPCTAVDTPPRSEKKDEDVKQYVSWAAEWVMEKMEGAPREARWILAFYGLRQSEALGLTDDCITWHKNGTATMTVQQVLERQVSEHGCGRPTGATTYPCGQRMANECPKARGGGGLRIRPSTKSKKSKRTIPVVEPLYSVLKAHMVKQRALRKSDGFAPAKGEKMDKLIFTTPTGKPIRHQDDAEEWRNLWKEGDKNRYRQHLNRHIAVSVLTKQKVPPAIIQSIIGHADYIMTLHYTEVAEEEAIEPLKELGKKISRRTKRGKEAAEKEELEAEAAAAAHIVETEHKRRFKDHKGKVRPKAVVEARLEMLRKEVAALEAEAATYDTGSS